MMKQWLAPVLCAVLLLSVLTACGPKETPGQSTVPADTGTETAAPVNLDDTQQAFLSFISGDGSVTTSDVFRTDDEGVNYDGLTYGSYTFAELRAKVAALEGSPANTRYALLDLGQDGIPEMMLRFESVDPTFYNWNGLVRNNGGTLELCDWYEDGYRTDATLYVNGSLLLSGSNGAGAESTTLRRFGPDGIAETVFEQSVFQGTFANGMVYDLGKEEADLTAPLPEESHLHVTEHAAGGRISFTADNFSKDAAIKAKEEAFLKQIAALGATRVSAEEMTKLCDLAPYCDAEVAWIPFGTDAVPDAPGTPTTAAEATLFTLTVYDDPSAEDYRALGEATVLNKDDPSLTAMRFVCDTDGVTVTLEQGEWDPAENAFVPQKAVFTVVTEAGKPYQFAAVLGETVPYYRLTATNGVYSAEWKALPDLRENTTTFVIHSSR